MRAGIRVVFGEHAPRAHTKGVMEIFKERENRPRERLFITPLYFWLNAPEKNSAFSCTGRNEGDAEEKRVREWSGGGVSS